MKKVPTPPNHLLRDVREINGWIRDYDFGHRVNPVYVIQRDGIRQRIIKARTKDGAMQVRLLSTCSWIALQPSEHCE